MISTFKRRSLPSLAALKTTLRNSMLVLVNTLSGIVRIDLDSIHSHWRLYSSRSSEVTQHHKTADDVHGQLRWIGICSKRMHQCCQRARKKTDELFIPRFLVKVASSSPTDSLCSDFVAFPFLSNSPSSSRRHDHIEMRRPRLKQDWTQINCLLLLAPAAWLQRQQQHKQQQRQLWWSALPFCVNQLWPPSLTLIFQG